MKKRKIIIGILVILIITTLTGCRNSAENNYEVTNEHAVVVLGPDGVTVENEITGTLADDYNVMRSDFSDWQQISSIPEEAEELYTFIYYEKKNDLSLLGNSGKFWYVSEQEILYRVEDTYYLKLGWIYDEKDGIIVNADAYYLLPDSVADEYLSLAENPEGYIDSEDFVSDFLENYEEKADDYFEQEIISHIEDELDSDWDLLLEDRLDREIEHFIDRTEGIIESGIGVLIRLILGIFLIPVIILYSLGAVGLYRMAKKMEYDSPWLAWIPIANLYLMFLLPGGSFRILGLNKVIARRENAFWIFIGGAMARRILRAISAFPGGSLFFMFDNLVSIVWLVFLIFFLYPLYRDLFRLFETEHTASTFAVWSLILPVLLPIFLLIAASKQPKKTDETPMIQTPAASVSTSA